MSGDIIIGNAVRDATDINTAKCIADKLEQHYPGYGWCVNASSEQGVIRIWSIHLSGKYGILCKYTEYFEDPSLRKIIRWAAEMLTRFQVRVGAVNLDQIESKKRTVGEIAFDYHEMKNAKVTDAVKMRWDYFKEGL